MAIGNLKNVMQRLAVMSLPSLYLLAVNCLIINYKKEI